MAKEYQFNWKPPVHPALVTGALFDKFEDVAAFQNLQDSALVDPNALVRVDDCGFYLYWHVEGKDSGLIDLSQVYEVRVGTLPKTTGTTAPLLPVVVDPSAQSALPKEKSKLMEAVEDRLVWLTFGNDLVAAQNIFLVSNEPETAKIWRAAINEIIKYQRIKHVCSTTTLYKQWRCICLATNDRRKIPTKNIIKLFSSGKPEKMVQKCMNDLGLGGDKYIPTPVRVMNKSLGRKLRNLAKCGAKRRKKEREELDVESLTFDKFLRLYHKICPRTDVQELFVKLSGQKEYLTREKLVTFLNDEQRDPRLNEILFPFFDNNRVQQLIAKYETDEKYISDGKMSGDAFLRFLMSDENAPVFLDRIELHQDMDQPLAHYYINSSHNTYLTGRQYGGKSSSEIYRTVLLSGCRCIELDCWDGTGENKGEPIITHGKAMCTDVFFRDVLYQIRDCAFVRSDFPVILSFENHCSKSNQLKMAKYCMDIFGDMLLTRPFDEHPLDQCVPLPSPNKLKRKILIKNKRLKPEIEKHQLEQFLREGKLDEEEETLESADAVDDASSPQPVGDDDSSGEDDPSVQSSSNVSRPRRSSRSPRPSLDRASTPLLISSMILLDRSLSTKAERVCTPSRSSPKFSLRHAMSAKRRHSPATMSSGSPPVVSALQSPASGTPPSSATSHGAGDQRAHPEVDTPTTSGGTPKATPGPSGLAEAAKAEDEAHPELKEKNFIAKLKPFGGKKQGVLTKEEEERMFAEYHYTGATTNIHPLLSSLVNYTHPVKFSGFAVAEDNNLHFHMSSFSESTGLGYLKQGAPEFVNYNKRQLSRIYPKGARVDSSNFLPQARHEKKIPEGFAYCIFWNAGCQMVSLNFQTPDIFMQLNQGKFEYNGNSGYLLKPDFMRRPDRSFDPFSESPVDGVIAAHCSVRVISGQFICDRKVGTYVEVEMYGLPTDTIRKEHRTKIVPTNGLNPIYGEDPFVFRKVVLPELAVLRFAVYDESGKQLGQRILPLEGLQAGYRHIGLRTESNMPAGVATLFVHIGLKTYVPEDLAGLVDALADPRAYLSAQQKRQEALHNMGVEDSDIVEVPAGGKNNSGKTRTLQKTNGSVGNLLNDTSTRTQTPRGDGGPGANSCGPGDGTAPSTSRSHAGGGVGETVPGAMGGFKVEAIDIADLKQDKGFVKLKRKFEKDEAELKRKHIKQRENISKQQQTNVDKLLTDNQRSQKRKDRSSTTSRHASLSGRESDPGAIAGNERMRSLVSSQTDEWSTLLKRHELEEFEMKRGHIREEFDLLKKLLGDAHKAQMTSLKSRLEAETKELRSTQTKKSMEDVKLIQMDKSFKSKAEKDRRVKELNEKNLKMFVEERKRLAIKAQKHEEQLTKRHTDQFEQLEKEAVRCLDLEDSHYKEELLASAIPISLC